MTTWIPHEDPSLPTLQLKIGKKAIGGEPEYVTLRKGKSPADGIQACFEANIVDDTGISSARMDNDIYLHPNVQRFYNGLTSGDSLTVLTDQTEHDIPECDEATLSIQTGNSDTIAQFLSATSCLLHYGMHEVVPADKTPDQFGKLAFVVHDVTPKKQTVRVTQRTTIHFENSPVSGPNPSNGSTDGWADVGTDAGKGSKENTQTEDVEEDGPDLERLLEVRSPSRSLDDDTVGLDGIERIALTLGRMVHPELREGFARQVGGLNTGVALLLYGPPGCGKSLAAETIAYELQHRCQRCSTYECSRHSDSLADVFGPIKFLEVQGDAISDKFVGEAPDKLRAIFDRAYELADDGNYVVLFFDEADNIIGDRANADQQYVQELTNTFLREVQGNKIEERNILLLGATNHPYKIDSAALDRFVLEEFIGPPTDADEMAELWRIEAGEQPNSDQLDYQQLGEESVGYVPREIHNLRREFIFRDYIGDHSTDAEDPPPITTDDYLQLLTESEPQTINRYLADLQEYRLELDGFTQLEEFYKEWSNRGT